MDDTYYDENPPVGSLADEDDELDSSGTDFKSDPVSDDELDSLIENGS